MSYRRVVSVLLPEPPRNRIHRLLWKTHTCNTQIPVNGRYKKKKTYSLVEPRNVSANLPFAGALAGVALRRIQITHYIRPTWPIFSLSPLVPLTFSLPLSLSLSLSFFFFFSFSFNSPVFLRPFLFVSRSWNPQRGSRAIPERTSIGRCDSV